MCGFFGFNDSSRFKDVDLQSVLGAIAFRGPDGQGIEDLSDQGGPLLGHTRLAVIGGQMARQPMWSDDKRYCITFNGEIYNFEELASSFGINHRGSDTRLLVELWSKLSIEILPLLRGQFAFALWDSMESKTYLATDFFGILPLYIHSEGERATAWSSSVRAFKASQLSLTFDDDRISEFLDSRFFTGNSIAFREVTKLKPRSLASITKDGKFECWEWASVDVLELKEEFSTKELAASIESSVQNALKADDQVGVFLSGGIDSGVIASIAAGASTQPINAYTATWGTSGHDSEIVAASELASRAQLRHIPVDISPLEWWRALIESVEFRESPSGEIADPVIYLLAERASQDVKVVLSGEGADELFLGYPKYAIENLLSAPVSELFTLLAAHVLVVLMPSNTRVKRICNAVLSSQKMRRWQRYFANESTIIEKNPSFRVLTGENRGDPSGLRINDLSGYLPNVLLERADRMGMAHGIEVRPAFLDLDLLQIAISLDSSAQTKFLKTKLGFRKAAAQIAGRDAAFRKSKGFPVPLSAWIRGELSDVFEQTLSSSDTRLSKEVSPVHRLAYLKEHVTGARDHSLLLFTWVSFILWERSWT